MKKIIKTLLAFGMLAIASTASAVPITGWVAFGNLEGATWSATGGDGTVSGATGVAFENTSVTGPDEAVVTTAAGDFAGSEGSTVDFMDFVFNPLAAGTQLWEFTYSGTTFSLLMNASDIVAQTNSIIALTGTGMMTGSGFDDTFGSWDLTLNVTGGQAFSFSSGAAPEPGVVLLLGAGLLGIGMARKMRKAA